MLDLLADDLIVAIDAMRVDRFQDCAVWETAVLWIAEPGAIGSAPPMACLTMLADGQPTGGRNVPQATGSRALPRNQGAKATYGACA